MDTNVPLPSNMQRPPFPPALAQGFPPQMMPVPGAFRPAPYYNGPFGNPVESFQKESQFARGVYVSGFQKSLTVEMLEKQFRIKPIVALKFPLTKFKDSKGFAFIYYESPDDATFVKEKLDHTVILQNKIRVTRTVEAKNLSKIMFRLKTNGLTEEQVKQIKEKYFNEKNLQAQISKIINSLLYKTVELNRIVFPRNKIDRSPLNYARGFFYISSAKEASRNIRMQPNQVVDNNPKKDYEVVLSYICEKLNGDPEFSKYVKAEMYEYTKVQNKSKILHIRNIKTNSQEDPKQITQEIKAWVLDQRKQAKIITCFTGKFGENLAWANVQFDNYDETKQAYEHFKNNLISFRGAQIYATLYNCKDPRTVAISTVRQQVTENDMKVFLSKLTEKSQRVDSNDQTKERKYNYHSFNIVEEKTFYYKDPNNPYARRNKDQILQENWVKSKTVPRRLVVHFVFDMSEEDASRLSRDIKFIDDWQKIFFEKNLTAYVRSNHQKGHIQQQQYIKHYDLSKKKSTRPIREPKPKMPREAGQFVFNKNQRPGGIPRNFPGNQNRDGSFRPPIRQGQMPPRPMGQMGPMPTMGSMINPKMGTIPIPVMGGMQVPQMGKPGGGMPAMGGFPQMGGLPPMPPMGLPPQMGTGFPTMGSGVPPMGAPKMSGNVTFGVPPSTQKKL